MSKIKRIVLLAVCTFVIFSIAGCGEKAESVEQSIANAITALKTQNEENIKKYFGGEDFDSVELYDTERSEQLKKIFQKLECKVVSSTIGEDKSTATAQLEITNFDMSDVMSKYFNDIMNQATSEKFSVEGLSEEEAAKKMEELLLDYISSAETTKSFSVEANLTKKDNVWVLGFNDDLADAFTGGLVSIGQSMEGMLPAGE